MTLVIIIIIFIFLLNFQSNLLSTLFHQIPNDVRENLNHTFHLNFTAQQYHLVDTVINI